MAGGGGSIRAGAAFVEIWLNDTRLVRGLRRAQAKLKAFGAAVRATGMRMMMAGAAIAAPLILAVKHFASMGDSIHKMSARTGIGAAALSELGFAAERSGTNLKTLEKGIQRMQRNIVDAGRGLSTAVDAFDMLGLSVEDLDGLSPEKQFELLADRISKIEDPTRRAAVAQMVFGKAGAALIPLLSEGAAGMDKLRKKARELGITMSDKDAAAAAKLTDALSDVWMSLKAGAFHIGAALGDSLTTAAKNVSEFIATMISWVKENQGLIVSVAQLAGALLAGGAALVTLGILFGSMAAIIGGVISVFGLVVAVVLKVVAVIGFILSPIGLVIAAVVALGAYLLYTTTAGGQALSWLGDMFSGLKDDALAAWKGIGDALAAGDIGLAAEILWLSLKMVWQKGVHELNKLWVEVTSFFVTAWNTAIFATAKTMVNHQADMRRGWIETTAVMTDVWMSFCNVLSSAFRDVVGEIQKAWILVKGLMDGLSMEEIALQALQVDRDTAAAKDKDANDFGVVAEARANDRNRRLSVIDNNRNKTLAALDAERRRKASALDADNKRAVSGTQASLDAAKAKRDKALAKAAHAARFKAGQRDGKPPAVPDFQREDMLANMGLAGLGGATKTSEASGTFSAFAVRGMQTGGPMERVAKATENTATSTNSIDEQLAEKRGVLFTT